MTSALVCGHCGRRVTTAERSGDVVTVQDTAGRVVRPDPGYDLRSHLFGPNWESVPPDSDQWPAHFTCDHCGWELSVSFDDLCRVGRAHRIILPASTSD